MQIIRSRGEKEGELLRLNEDFLADQAEFLYMEKRKSGYCDLNKLQVQ